MPISCEVKKGKTRSLSRSAPELGEYDWFREAFRGNFFPTPSEGQLGILEELPPLTGVEANTSVGSINMAKLVNMSDAEFAAHLAKETAGISRLNPVLGDIARSRLQSLGELIRSGNPGRLPLPRPIR